MSGKWSLYESINSKYIQDYFWFQIPSGININLECLFNTASWKSVCVGRVDRRLGFIAISKNTMESKKNLEILSKKQIFCANICGGDWIFSNNGRRVIISLMCFPRTPGNFG